MSDSGKQNYKTGDLVNIMWTSTAEKENAQSYVGQIADASDQNALKINIHCRGKLRIVTLGWSTINPILKIERLLDYANTRHICCMESEARVKELEDYIS